MPLAPPCATARRGTARPAPGLEIRAIIPGRIASVAVAAGDAVEIGQTLLAVEAMKMQNELRAPRAGTVARVAATAGTTVELGDLLVVLE
jgi:biotin carboxyl carrier protein